MEPATEPWKSVRPTYAAPAWEDTGHVLISHASGYRPLEPSAGLRVATVIRPLLPPPP